MNAIVEICADSFNSALAAQKGGAARIELCDNLMLGGTTPSYGVIKRVMQCLTIKCNVLIRPRTGDFIYSDDEVNIMLDDIIMCKQLGVNGVVIGALNIDGDIDQDIITRLITAAGDMEITFHRAFDITRNPLLELENIKRLGIHRLLTSGQRKTAFEGKNLIRKLVANSDNVIIMPGSGNNEKNIIEIAHYTQAKEFHLSAKQLLPSTTKYFHPEVLMGDEKGISELRWDESNVDSIKRIVDLLNLL